MLAKQIGIVLCRVAAVVLVVQTVGSFAYILPVFFQDYDAFEFVDVLQALAVLVPGLVAVFLWVFAERISTVPGQDDSDSSAAPMSQTDLIGVGTLVIGIYVFVMAIFGIVQAELTAHMMRDMADRYSDQESFGVLDREVVRMNARRITNLVELLLGALLIFGRASIARLLTKARRAGTGAA